MPQKGQEEMGAFSFCAPRVIFNNSFGLYTVGRRLICSIWGDSSVFCQNIAGVLNEDGILRQ